MIKNKIYSLERLKNYKKLIKFLKIDDNLLNKIENDKVRDLYKISITDNDRTIHSPHKSLKKSQKILLKYLSSTKLPDYLFAPSIKNNKKNNIENAKYHLENKYFLTMDISKFYNSIKYDVIENYFKSNLKFDNNEAILLSRLVTYKDENNSILSTGSPTSQMLAYLLYKDIFNKVNRICLNKNIKFSLYVDDMTFSSKIKISKKFQNQIIKIFEEVNLTFNEKKIKKYNKKFAIVTGVVIKNNKIAIRNKNRKKIIDLLIKLKRKSNEVIINEIQNSNQDTIQTIRKLNGLLNYTYQIENDEFINTKNRIDKLYKYIHIHASPLPPSQFPH